MRYHPRKSPLLCYHEDAEKALGTKLFEELAALNHSIYLLLLQRKVKLRFTSPTSQEASVFKRLAPIGKNLSKLLHQRNAVQNFQMRTLEQALDFISEELQLALEKSYSGILSNQDVERLPVTGALVSELYAIVGPTAKRALSKNALLEQLAGTNFREVADAYGALVTKQTAARRNRVNVILQKVHASLLPEEFKFLKDNLSPQDLARFRP